jgi:hypothetical protein
MRINTQTNIKNQDSTRKKIILKDLITIVEERCPVLVGEPVYLTGFQVSSALCPHYTLIGAIIILYGPNLTQPLRRMLSLH